MRQWTSFSQKRTTMLSTFRPKKKVDFNKQKKLKQKLNMMALISEKDVVNEFKRIHQQLKITKRERDNLQVQIQNLKQNTRIIKIQNLQKKNVQLFKRCQELQHKNQFLQSLKTIFLKECNDDNFFTNLTSKNQRKSLALTIQSNLVVYLKQQINQLLIERSNILHQLAQNKNTRKKCQTQLISLYQQMARWKASQQKQQKIKILSDYSLQVNLLQRQFRDMRKSINVLQKALLEFKQKPCSTTPITKQQSFYQPSSLSNLPLKQQQQPQQQHIKTRKVHLQQINQVIKHIKIKIAYQNISIKSIIESIQNPIGVISIVQVSEKLRAFGFKGGQQLYKLARYLIQGDDLNIPVQIDDQTSQKVAIVRSVLRKLIGKISYFCKNQEQHFERLRNIIVCNIKRCSLYTSFSIQRLSQQLCYQFSARQKQYIQLIQYKSGPSNNFGQFTKNLKNFIYDPASQ